MPGLCDDERVGELPDVTATPTPQPRRGLVLGGGAILGFSWAVGALRALEEHLEMDARDFDMLVGVSAGAIMASLLACGVESGPILRQQRGVPAPDDPRLDYSEGAIAGADGRPPRPDWGFGSPALLARAARRPGQIPPIAALSGALPVGTGSLAPIEKVIADVCPGSWAPHPSLWITAMDYQSGRRVVFGRAGDPVAPLPQAVAASCAIPSWFAPVEIDGHKYVDGGMFSNTSADLLAGQGLDEVYVIAPMASYQLDNPEGVLAKLERRWRRVVTRRLQREVEKVRASGAVVTILGPGRADLTAMGGNLMDASRRLTVVETSLATSATALRMLARR